MCGFAGLYRYVFHDAQVRDTQLERLHLSLKHRGPDAHGVLYDSEHQLALVARRLSINDLSPASDMPLIRKDLGLAIVYNGELYNFKQLRSELESLGYIFTSQGDTEVVLVAYKAWGRAALDKFEGMFAFVLYDFNTTKLLLVRDRIGVKPLYFAPIGGAVAFASEIKAFWALDLIKKELSPIAWYHYLTFMATPAPYTIFNGVYKLPAGHLMEVDQHGRMSFEEWYNPARNAGLTVTQEAEAIDMIDMLLNASVKKRMVADVPVGAFLSGGLDSSLITALMARHTTNLKTFTIGFEEQSITNEFPWARRVAELCGADYNEIKINESDAFDFYPKMVQGLDEPIADCVCLPFYFVSKAAHDAGLKVVQVGEGADELFFGYNTYARYAQFESKSVTKVIPDPIKKVMRLFAHEWFHDQPFKREAVENWYAKRPLFWGGALAFGELQKREMINISDRDHEVYDPIIDQIYPGLKQTFDSHSLIDYHLSVLRKHNPNADFAQQMMYLELKHRLPELLLMRADKMSMATSLEAREPFLDHALVEYMMRVDISLKYKNKTTKYLLKKVAERYLPREIIYREKVGFGAPTAWWYAEGKHFPSYYHRLARAAESSAHSFGSINPINIMHNKNSSHRAVQNWTLQQLWAFSQALEIR